MLRAAVPVAAVYEDGDLSWTEDQVCCTAKVRQGACGHAVAQSLSVH